MPRSGHAAGPDPHVRRTQASPPPSAAPATIPERLGIRVLIQRVRPQINHGRYPIKRTPGEPVTVTADIFADGHDAIAAVLRFRRAPDGRWQEAPMTAVGNDAWTATFTPEAVGWYEYAVVAWVDRFASWHHDLAAKFDASQDVSSELLEGSMLVRAAIERARSRPDVSPAQIGWLTAQAETLAAHGAAEGRVAAAGAPALRDAMSGLADRSRAAISPALRVRVDRERARFGAWYEMFPRSVGSTPTHGGTFRKAEARLPAIADMGFDVLYLPPIHPIGMSFRKGRNNRLRAETGEPGSPWAIGSEAGGHMAVDPGLGTLEDFAHFRDATAKAGLEIALDLAYQCSPDHPWVREHPEWFRHRPDGTIKYAENPPKKYQDIYPLDFECTEWRALWQELRRVVLFWIARGVRIFRVDNPHTKPFGFWEWLIRDVQATHPDVIFLAEAFTRPKPMRYLAMAGFSQSYTYFTWRNSGQELVDYFTELTQTEVREYLRPNLFTNTPDILTAFLQTGGRPAFQIRLVLAATLGASYGIYSGFELCEDRAVPDSEEYHDSEKYQYRQWDWDQPGNIQSFIARVNRIRNENPALHWNHALRFHGTDNPELLYYSKTSPDGANTMLVVVNLDPHNLQHGWVQTPIDAFGIAPTTPYTVHDLLSGTSFRWIGEWNYVRLDPQECPVHILRLER